MYDPGTLQEKLFAEPVWQSMIHGQFAAKLFAEHVHGQFAAKLFCRACEAEYDPGSVLYRKKFFAKHVWQSIIHAGTLYRAFIRA